MKTVGTLRYETDGLHRGRWLIDAQPHVATRIKRLFARVATARTGTITVADSVEVARDLEWLMDRHPLQMDESTRGRLQRRAQAHRDQEDTVVSILAGKRMDYGDRAPAEEPRDYQWTAADLAVATRRLLLTDDVGLGKTFTSLLMLRAKGALPALVVTYTHLQDQWVDEVAKFLPWLTTHVLDSTRPYDPTTRRGVDRQPDVLISSYHKLAGWADHLAGEVKSVIFDEAQELRRSESAKYQAAARIADAATYRLGATATPVYNYGGEIHNVVSVLDKEALGTREEFIREWGAGDTYGGQKVKVKDPAALGAYLREQGLMLGRTRKEVGRELPEAVRISQMVSADVDVLERLSGNAVEMARLILDANSSTQQRWQASGELDATMRQATGIAKAPFVAEFVRMLLESEERVVLFGWHRAVYELWAEQLAEFNPVFYTGDESRAAKARSAEAFKSGESRVLVMSLRSGAGLDGLQEVCKVAVFGELDWSPQVHGQCIGRLRRDGQDDIEPVLAYFLWAAHGSDPQVAEVLNIKRMQSEPMMDPNAKLFEPAGDGPDRMRRLAQDVLDRHGGRSAARAS